MADILTKEEFDKIVVLPIRAAYREKEFLNEITEAGEYEFWYEVLKEMDKELLERNVNVWITHESFVPVLADISRGLISSSLYKRSFKE